MKVSLVPVEHINDVWDVVRPMLEPAVSVTNGRFSTYSVYNDLQRGDSHLWIAFDDEGNIHGAVTTDIIDYPEKRCLSMTFVGGSKFSEWSHPLNEILENWARDNQCEAIEGQGRPAWNRLVRRFGCKPLATIFERNV